MLTDRDEMPWGKYKGETMENVPADYLLYMYTNNKVDSEVKKYIEDNMDVLEEEYKKVKGEDYDKTSLD